MPSNNNFRERRNNYNWKDAKWTDLKKILEQGFKFDAHTEYDLFKFNGYLENFAASTGMKSTQVRKIFNELKKIERKYKDNNCTVQGHFGKF